LPGACIVLFARGGYWIEIDGIEIRDELGETGSIVTGTVQFAPVPNLPNRLATPCRADFVCAALDPNHLVPEAGWCLPASNLGSDAPPCDASCTTPQITFVGGGASQCICSTPCGDLAGFGGVPPTCDPVYGCVPG